MAIKVCKIKIAFNCSKTTTVGPPRTSGRIEWICPACGEFLRKHPAHVNARYGTKKERDLQSLVRSMMRIHQ
jgi:hypothetical protein